jgi:prepilin-type N-terminal cleavage/methylation domain-containing protein
MNKNVQCESSGFTLIELLVVIAIIGVLAAIAIPRFQVFAAASKRSEGVITLRALVTSEKSYFASADSYATGPSAFTQLGYDPGALKYYLYSGQVVVGCASAALCPAFPAGEPCTTYLSFISGNLDADPQKDDLYVQDIGVGCIVFLPCPMNEVCVLTDDVHT